MRHIEIWMETFDDLRARQRLHAGAVSRAHSDHEAAVQSGDVDLIMRSSETLRDCQARLNIITDLLENHQQGREAALAADRREALAELVREHEPLKAEGVEALDRLLGALEVFGDEVDRFASVVTKVQTSALQCGQLPAIRMTLDQQNILSTLHETKNRFFDAVRRASSSQV